MVAGLVPSGSSRDSGLVFVTSPSRIPSLEILALLVVENIILLGRYATSLGIYNVVTSRVGLRGTPSLGVGGR